MPLRLGPQAHDLGLNKTGKATGVRGGGQLTVILGIGQCTCQQCFDRRQPCVDLLPQFPVTIVIWLASHNLFTQRERPVCQVIANVTQ